MNFRMTVKHNPVGSFIILYLVLNLAALLLPVVGEGAFIALLSVMVLVPTFVAVALVAFVDGRREAAAFLRQSLRWRSPLKWYLIAFAIGFLAQFGGSIVAVLAGRISVPEFGAPTVFLFVLIPWALLEEIGLRGFTLRRLLEKHSPLAATLIVAVPWVLVHVALIVLHPPDGRAALAEGLSLLAMAVPHTWVFIKSKRNVWVATILHWAFNVMGSVAGPYRAVPEAESFWYTTLAACVIAAAFILLDWRMWFARPAGSQANEVAPSVA